MYVPVMKNRTVEISVLQQLGAMHVFDGDVIPLVELIQERTRSNNKNTFIQDLCAQVRRIWRLCVYFCCTSFDGRCY